MHTHRTQATLDSNGSLHIDALPFSAGEIVEVFVYPSNNGGTVDTVAPQDEAGSKNTAEPLDPLAGIRVATGIPDLAEHFDDYRFGKPRS